MIDEFIAGFNKQILEMQGKEVTFFGRKTGIKFSKILPYATLVRREDSDGNILIDLIVPVPKVTLVMSKAKLTEQLLGWFKSKGVEAEIKML